MAKVICTKSKIDSINNGLSDAIGIDAQRTLDGMTTAVQSANTQIGTQSDLLDQALNELYDKSALNNVENKTWSQENPVVADYLDEVEYSPSDYSVSYIENYSTQTTTYRKDRPQGVDVSVDAGHLYLVSDDRAIHKEVTTGTETIENIRPATNTGYYVANNKKGTLSPTGFLRMINGGGNTFNIRDIGGWECDGGTLKYGLVFRGGELNGDTYHVVLSPEQIEFFKDFLGIRDEIDFRGDSDVDGDDGIIGTIDDITSSALGPSVDYVRYPIAAYANGVNLAARVQTGYYRDILKRIAKDLTESKPLYLHCLVGADRTGTVCCLIEAICGVAQSDIDKDYELTSFSAGNLRRRTGSDWRGLIDRINSFEGSTFRDKVVSYALQAGVTIDDINAIRNGLIDGTPTALVSPYSDATVTRTLTHTSSSNTDNSTEKFQPYETELSAENGYVISSVSVTMNGLDITSSCFSGQEVNLLRQITKVLTNCSIDTSRQVVIDGQMYGCTITPASGYEVSDLTVTITMGGVNVSNYYSNGKIIIPNVTGDIVITAVAEHQGSINYFDASTAEYNKRINSSGATVAYGTSQLVTDYIGVTLQDIIELIADKAQDDNSYTGMIAFYDSSKGYLGQIDNRNTHWTWGTGNLTGDFAVSDGFTNTAFVRICIAYTSTDNIVIHLNN